MKITDYKNLKVLIVTPTMELGGVENWTIDVATFLKEKGHTPIVISAGGKKLSELHRHKIEHIKIPVHTKSLFNLRKNARTIAKIIKDKNIDIVQVGSRAPAWSCKWACKKTKTPLITTFHAKYNFKGKIKKYYNSIMLAGDKTIVPSNFIENHIKQDYQKNSKEYQVIHNWVDTKKFDSEKITQDNIADVINEYSIPEDKKIITYTGRITQSKGIDFIINTCKYIEENFKRNDFKILIIGSGKEKYLQHVKDTIKDLKLENYIQLTGLAKNIQDLTSLIKLGNLSICPSIQPESFGLSCAEAQSMGKWTIATNIGGFLEIIKDGKTGKLIEPDNCKEFANAIIQALDFTKEQVQITEKNCKLNILNNFEKEKQINKIIALYKDTIKNYN